eukprot:854227-Prymnesium_polylepis.1
MVSAETISKGYGRFRLRVREKRGYTQLLNGWESCVQTSRVHGRTERGWVRAAVKSVGSCCE